MRLKIFLILFIIAIGVLVYFAYPIVKNRYFKNESSAKNEKQEPNANAITNNNTKSSDEMDNTIADTGDEEDSASSSEIKDEIDESGDTANITAEDCDNECLSFKDNAGNLKYCQNICGLSLTNESENCDSKAGSDRDYCFKNEAVAKTDLNICNSITDEKIKSSCKNRVMEDLLEQQ
jgi:hypothetical protein